MMVPLEARTPNAHAWREACLPVNGDGLCVVYPSHTGIQYISSLRAATANWFRSLSQHENVRSYTCGPEKGTGKKAFLSGCGSSGQSVPNQINKTHLICRSFSHHMEIETSRLRSCRSFPYVLPCGHAHDVSLFKLPRPCQYKRMRIRRPGGESRG